MQQLLRHSKLMAGVGRSRRPRAFAHLHLFVCATSLVVVARVTAADSAPNRVQSGLHVLYDFATSDGTTVNDRAGVEPPLDLRIGDLKATRQSGEGLELVDRTLITTGKPAARLIEAIKQSGDDHDRGVGAADQD